MVLGLLAGAGALLVAVGIGLVRRVRDGRLRAERLGAGDPASSQIREALRAVGVEPRVTLVHFSTPVCAPCRAVRRVCHEAVARVQGLAALEVDVDTHLEAVRALGVWRVPTVLVVDASARIVRRAVGVPRLDDLLATVGALT